MVYAVDAEARQQTRLHSQPGLELNLTCRGRGILQVGAHRYPLGPGRLVLIPEGYVHRLEAQPQGAYVRSVLCIAPAAHDSRPLAEPLRLFLKQAPLRKPRSIQLDGKTTQRVRELIARMAAEERRQAGWWQEVVFAQAYEVLALAARLATQTSPSQPPARRLMEEIAAYVTAQLDGDLTMKAISEHFGISREHLSRLFHQHFGVTYQHYVLNQRIQAARRLLIETGSDTPLLEIALSVGFQSHAHFSRVFRKYSGLTPTLFRQLNQFEAENGMSPPAPVGINE